jgi:nucleotide-binding universal stress UspA family protein
VALEGDAPFTVLCSMGTGNLVDQIIAAAGEREVDLIATAGHHGFLDALRSSTIQCVLRNAPCPVLAVPAHGAP